MALSSVTRGKLVLQCHRLLWCRGRQPYHDNKSPEGFIPIPYVTDRGARGEYAMDIFSKLLKERIICLMGPIFDPTAATIVAQLLLLHSESPKKPIHMYINSPGGSIASGLAIYDTMKFIDAPVATWCIGQACSMGSFLLCAGTPGMRHALPNSRIMVHQPSGQAQGQASDMLIQAEEILRLKKRLNQLYCEHTKQPYDIIDTMMERDRYMSPEEAKEFGLIDTVLKKSGDSNTS